MAKKVPKEPPKIVKTVDEEYRLTKPRKGAKVREEVWQFEDGKIAKYNLAYINHRICGRDNGRVLGYDNSHEGHHRHFMGKAEPVQFESYDAINERFYAELAELWREEDAETKK